MNKTQVDVDCTRQCRSRCHGKIITSAITKRSISDHSLASFIRATCANFTQAFDFEGRTALHMAASRGRVQLMEWLLRHSSDAFANAKDRESGYTPLHRSIFYGQIHAAVALMKMGVKLDIVDKDDYRALDHAMLDRQYIFKQTNTEPTDVYVWGSNCNYTLGTGSQQPRSMPELLTSFSRTNAHVKQVCLGKFHTIWVCNTSSDNGEGDVWCCGQLARAGGPPATALRPVPLRLPEPCISAAVTLDSTVFLLQSGAIVQYNLNNTDAGQPSKIPSIIKLQSVKPLMKLSKPIGVCAGRSHVVFWNSKAVYTWGVNVGQLGHSREEKIVSAPKRVAISLNINEEAGIQLAAAADAATVFTTSRGDVYLLHNYICKKIAIKQINLGQVCVECKVNEQGVFSRVTVLLLTNVGQLLLWQDNANTVTRCVFGLTHQTFITHVFLTHDALYFTTKYGEAFIGHISRKVTPSAKQQPTKREKNDNNKSSLVKFLEKEDCTSVKIRKIPNIHRAVSVAVDNEGLNFACLQVKPVCGLLSLPELSPSCISKHMEALMETASRDDILHDVVFKVGAQLYPAHIFIVASNSEHMYKLYQENMLNPGDKPVVTLDNVLPEVFDRIMRFMYTGSCDVTELGPCALKIRKEDLIASGKKVDNNVDLEVESVENSSEVSAFEVYSKAQKRGGRRKETPSIRTQHVYCDPVKLVQATAKRLQLTALHKRLDKFYYKDGSICLKENATYIKQGPTPLTRESFPELFDTNVCSRDGVKIYAHKCVLAARLEYFHGMFMHSWTESKLLSTVSLPISDSILRPVIDFLYSDTCPEIESSDNLDFLCSMLVVADQLFIIRLREMCEVSLSNLINLKNCAELCQFAHTYNATQLKQCCMEFISLNVSSILENGSLNVNDNNVLLDITNYYCKFNPIMSSRIITPFFNAETDAAIEECHKNYPVDINVTDEDLRRDNSVTEIPKKKKSTKKIEYTESEKARMRYESVSSVNSLDLSNESYNDITFSLDKLSMKEEKIKQDKWTEVPSNQQKQQKLVQARLKVINSAKDIINEPQTESFTKLSKHNSASNIPETSSTSRLSVSPIDMPIVETSPQGNIIFNRVGPKLSQKHRKKLVMQGEHPPHVDNSYIDNLRIVSPPAKPKNPWKVCEPPTATSSPNKPSSIEFNKILADQKKLKDDSSRIIGKPLIMTQLEDKAIEELERFYNIHEVDDEFITVRRIELQVLSPQWNHNASKS